MMGVWSSPRVLLITKAGRKTERLLLRELQNRSCDGAM